MKLQDLVAQLTTKATDLGDRVFDPQKVSGRRAANLAANETVYTVRYWQLDADNVAHPHTIEILVADEGTEAEVARWNTRLPHVLREAITPIATEQQIRDLLPEMRQASIRHDTDGAVVQGLQVLELTGELEQVTYLVTKDSRGDLRAERIRERSE